MTDVRFGTLKTCSIFPDEYFPSPSSRHGFVRMDYLTKILISPSLAHGHIAYMCWISYVDVHVLTHYPYNF